MLLSLRSPQGTKRRPSSRPDAMSGSMNKSGFDLARHWLETFRFDLSSLICDSALAVSNRRLTTFARRVAVMMLALLLLPATVAAFGGIGLGASYPNSIAVGLALLLWPIILELPSSPCRRREVEKLVESVGQSSRRRSFNWTRYLIQLFVGAGALHVAMKWQTEQSFIYGLFLGIAVAASVEFARLGVAAILTGLDGYPLYNARAHSTVLASFLEASNERD